MPFRSQSLVRLCGAGSFSLWHYDAGEDGPDAVLSDGYFSSVYRDFEELDRVIVHASNKEVSFELIIETVDPNEVITSRLTQSLGFQSLAAVKRRNDAKKEALRGKPDQV